MKASRLAAAGTLTALAILQKLTVIFVALPALYLFWRAYGRKLLWHKEPYVFALIAGIPALMWYVVHANAIESQSVLSALAMPRNPSVIIWTFGCRAPSPAQFSRHSGPRRSHLWAWPLPSSVSYAQAMALRLGSSDCGWPAQS